MGGLFNSDIKPSFANSRTDLPAPFCCIKTVVLDDIVRCMAIGFIDNGMRPGMRCWSWPIDMEQLQFVGRDEFVDRIRYA
jgi:hypothetical protein